jgi:hypothetical protein
MIISSHERCKRSVASLIQTTNQILSQRQLIRALVLADLMPMQNQGDVANQPLPRRLTETEAVAIRPGENTRGVLPEMMWNWSQRTRHN